MLKAQKPLALPFSASGSWRTRWYWPAMDLHVKEIPRPWSPQLGASDRHCHIPWTTTELHLVDTVTK
jgi:hypothetical protein